MFSILLGHPFLSLLPRSNRLSLELFGFCFLLLLLICAFKKIISSLLEASAVSCLGYMGGSKEMQGNSFPCCSSSPGVPR